MINTFKMQKYSIAIALLATCLPTPIAFAQSNGSKCSQAIAQNKAILPNNKQSVRTGAINTQYEGTPPKGRSQHLSFVFLGDRVKNEAAIAEKIITSCPKIGVVSFILWGTDDETRYGLLNRKIERFQCKDMEEKVIKWGEFRCP
jgi:hypothetical protein